MRREEIRRGLVGRHAKRRREFGRTRFRRSTLLLKG